jgi:hypothetical protein
MSSILNLCNYIFEKILFFLQPTTKPTVSIVMKMRKYAIGLNPSAYVTTPRIGWVKTVGKLVIGAQIMVSDCSDATFINITPKEGFSNINSGIESSMLAVLPYARGRGFDSRSRIQTTNSIQYKYGYHQDFQVIQLYPSLNVLQNVNLKNEIKHKGCTKNRRLYTLFCKLYLNRTILTHSALVMTSH